jgi:hypothetical protein
LVCFSEFIEEENHFGEGFFQVVIQQVKNDEIIFVEFFFVCVFDGCAHENVEEFDAKIVGQVFAGENALEESFDVVLDEFFVVFVENHVD